MHSHILISGTSKLYSIPMTLITYTTSQASQPHRNVNRYFHKDTESLSLRPQTLSVRLPWPRLALARIHTMFLVNFLLNQILAHWHQSRKRPPYYPQSLPKLPVQALMHLFRINFLLNQILAHWHQSRKRFPHYSQSLPKLQAPVRHQLRIDWEASWSDYYNLSQCQSWLW